MVTTSGERRPARRGTSAQPIAERGSVRQRAIAGLVRVGSWLACHLPEGPLMGLAVPVGELWYRIDRTRRDQARRNLRRVVGWAGKAGLATPVTRTAAADPGALERLVRSAFRHYVRYYLEVARTPTLTEAYLAERLTVDPEALLGEALAPGRPVIFIGLHFGALELPSYVGAVHTGGRMTVPMETIGDAALQRFFVRTRGSVGIRIIGLAEARRELGAALGRGEAVGLVADRDLTGGGLPATLFGAAASLPLGPALLAVESDAPAYVVAVRRTGGGHYLGRLWPLPRPAAGGGTRRDRVTAFLEAEARAFEVAIVEAPEQWWGAFFPIWPDLEGRP